MLHAPCAPVTAFDDELVRLVDEMVASMRAHEGVGLAANQIGVPLRVFVYDCEDDDGVRHTGHVVNPTLRLPRGRAAQGRGAKVFDEEGCLSVPGVQDSLARWGQAVVSGRDVTGAPVVVRGTGYFARCLQHEVDHLDGLLYVDRLSGTRRAALMARYADARRGAAPSDVG